MIANEIITIESATGKRKIKSYISCETCEAFDDIDTFNCEQCLWRENKWKYDEIFFYLHFAEYKIAGFDLNRFSNLTPDEFIKIYYIERLLNG